MFETALALLIFLFPLAYSPGPGNLFFAANGARFGFGATVPANLGYHLATWIVTLIIGLGFANAGASFPNIFNVLRILGAAYVLWIAWGLFRSGVLVGEGEARPAGFVDGVVLLLLNPKAYVIIALMFVTFLGPDANWRSVGMITTLFTLNNMLAFMVWTVAGDALARRFRSKAGARRLNAVLASALAGVAIWMLLG